jgi:hypothetical protein
MACLSAGWRNLINRVQARRNSSRPVWILGARTLERCTSPLKPDQLSPGGMPLTEVSRVYHEAR